MRTALSTHAASSGAYTGPNRRGVGLVEVHADLRSAGVAPGAVLVVDFDRRRVLAGGKSLVTAEGTPEVLQLRRFPRGLRAQIGGRWVAVARDDMRDLVVVGRVVQISHAAV